MDITDHLKLYAEKEFADDIINFLMVQDHRKHHAIAIDTISLFAENVSFAHQLFESPLMALKSLNEAFQKAALSIQKEKKLKSELMITDGNLHARLTALPKLSEIYRLIFPNCSDVGQFMCLCGTVIRATASKMIEFKKLWKCNKCKYSFTIDAEVDQGYVSEKPTACSNPDWCNGKNFTLLSRDVDPTYCKDYQEIKLQEQAYNLTIGSVPRSMWIILEDDLVDSCQPGNDVIVSGVLIQRWKPLAKGKAIEIDLVLLAHNVEVKNKLTHNVVPENLIEEFSQFWENYQSDPLKGRDFILSSICPQVFGLYIVKLAVALVLAGGVEKKDENTRIRGDSHLLLVGDPGTGKSQFLKFASKVSMRSVLTSGIGTTNAGLTVSAIKEGGKWQLEAGALVLADGGICCIDEFSCIKEHDKTCIHEAMEQQTISVAKAGLVCSLSTRCSILAVTNPKGKYDEHLSISENTALASPLLSRFDIILVLLDNQDEKWDDMVASYILKGSNLLNRKSNDSVWSLTKMRNYFSLIRNIKPKVTPASEKVLQTYYRRKRSLEERNFARTTPRLLQSLIRLAEGHARLMFRCEVLIVDAIIAIILIESSMSGSSILSGLNALHTSFPNVPKIEYENQAETILKHLNLENYLEEVGNYGANSVELTTEQLLLDISNAHHVKKDSNSQINAVTGVSQSAEYICSVPNSINSFRRKEIDSNVQNLQNTVIMGNFASHEIIPTSHVNSNNLQVDSPSERQIDNLNEIEDVFNLIMSTNDSHKESIVQRQENYSNTEKIEDIDIMDLIRSSIEPHANEDNRIQPNNSSPLKKTVKSGNSIENDVTTLSDLNNIFQLDFAESAAESFGRIFKRKQSSMKNSKTSDSFVNIQKPDKVAVVNSPPLKKRQSCEIESNSVRLDSRKENQKISQPLTFSDVIKRKANKHAKPKKILNNGKTLNLNAENVQFTNNEEVEVLPEQTISPFFDNNKTSMSSSEYISNKSDFRKKIQSKLSKYQIKCDEFGNCLPGPSKLNITNNNLI